MKLSFAAKHLISALLVTGGWVAYPQRASAACPALPYTLTNGQPADATQLMADLNSLQSCSGSGPAGSTNSLQYNAGSGTYGGVGPLTNGQIIIGSTGAAPQAATITAGSGITIANAPGSITITASGSAVAAQREFGPFLPPAASSFTSIDSPGSITPTVTDVANVGLVYSTPLTTNTSAYPGAYRSIPTTTPWTITMRAKYATLPGNWPSFGFLIKDSGGKMIGALLENSGGYLQLLVKHLNSNIGPVASNPYSQTVGEPPSWFRVSYDGTNIKFYVSWDGQNWLYFWTETNNSFLNGNLQAVGVGGLTEADQSIWLAGSRTGAIITYWSVS